MRIILILLLAIQPVFAAEIVSVLDMPANSRYNLVPYIAKMKPQIIKEVKNTEVVENEPAKLVLSGIFKIGDTYAALINGDSYKVNDLVSGYKIKKININSAILIKKGKKVIIYVENN
jgi:hypothetical protein